MTRKLISPDRSRSWVRFPNADFPTYTDSMTKLLRPAHHPEEIEKEKFASLKELDVEKKHWLKEMVKLDMRAMAGDLKLLDQKIHRRKGDPCSEEEEHTIVVWILVRERLQSRNWSVGR